MTHVLHVFFDVNMGRSFGGLGLMLGEKIKRDLKQGECAVFLNQKWSAAKILYSGGLIAYWNKGRGQTLTYDELRALPERLSHKLEFHQKAERALVIEGAKQGRRRVVKVTTEDEMRA